MRLTVVGCSGSFPAMGNPASCYLLEADGFRLLLDLGNGALTDLPRYAGLEEIDAIVLSHLHPDHCLDLCAYYVARYYPPDGRRPPLPVYGPAGTPERMVTAYGSAGECMPEVFDFQTMTPSVFDIGPFGVAVDRVNHPVETFGIRLSFEGRTLTYSGDTGESDALVRLAEGTDLLLCEASFLDGWAVAPNLHLTGRQAGEHATRAGAGRLVLTHLPPWTPAEPNRDAARAAYAGPVELARPGAQYDL